MIKQFKRLGNMLGMTASMYLLSIPVIIVLFGPPACGFYAGVSVLTSSVKTIRGECGMKYYSDRVFYGDIFCSKED